MPVWSEVLSEISTRSQHELRAYDNVRRNYLLALSKYTKRDTILYASSWLQRTDISPSHSSIVDEDIHALMEVTSDISGPNLDLILHSPGGSPEAAEAIVSFLRSRYRNIRVIVPHLAMSAATMIACSANVIAMGRHSFLGPTDPQLLLPTPIGTRFVPAQAVLDQFKLVKEGAIDQKQGSVWLPLMSQLGPDLIVQCQNAVELSQELVRTWLENYMFKDLTAGRSKAAKISTWLAKHSEFKSHARHLPRERLVAKGLGISFLENDPTLQDLSLSVFHATTILFSNFELGKIVENQNGRVFVK